MVENDDQDAKVMRFYERHQRTKRWAQWCRGCAAAAGWVLGLALITAILYMGDLVYLRVNEDEARIAKLEKLRPTPSTPQLAAPPEAVNAAPAPIPTEAKLPPGWSASEWTPVWREYLRHTLATTVSSAVPPAHRHSQ